MKKNNSKLFVYFNKLNFEFIFQSKKFRNATIILSFCLLVWLWLFCWHSSLDKDVIIDIEKGQNLSILSDKMKNDGIIYSETFFKGLMFITGNLNNVKIGRYKIPSGASLWKIKNIVSNGKVFEELITIPEGLTVKQIIERLENDTRFTGKITVNVSDGDLLPDSYFIRKDMSRDDFLLMMKDAMQKAIDKEWNNRASDVSIKSKEDAIIMASIVEKETQIEAERPMVASVLLNRIQKRMKLQMDPTVVYAVTNGYGHMKGKPLLTGHLKKDSPYNTYVIFGLPKGPICNPGISSIRAVLNPAKTDYLYFVADGTGGHIFASTLEEHQKNHDNWRKIRKEKQKQDDLNK